MQKTIVLKLDDVDVRLSMTDSDVYKISVGKSEELLFTFEELGEFIDELIEFKNNN